MLKSMDIFANNRGTIYTGGLIISNIPPKSFQSLPHLRVEQFIQMPDNQ